MRPFPVLAALALSAAPAVPAAQPKGDLKIGYVDLQRALNEVEEGKAAKAQLKKDFEEKQKALDKDQEELKRMKAEFDKQSVVMAEEARREKQGDLDRKFMEVQGKYVTFQRDLSERERETTRGIFDKMTQIIREIAEAESFGFVFERNDAGLIYAPASLDLTNELVRKYNAKYKGGGEPAKKKAEPKAEGGEAGKKKPEAAKK
jgi:outer membrane protein